MWDLLTFSAFALPSQERTKEPQRSRGILQRVIKSFASARNERILRPDASLNRCRNKALRRVSRSIGFLTRSAGTIATDSRTTDETAGVRTAGDWKNRRCVGECWAFGSTSNQRDAHSTPTALEGAGVVMQNLLDSGDEKGNQPTAGDFTLSEW